MDKIFIYFRIILPHNFIRKYESQYLRLKHMLYMDAYI